MSCYQIEEKCFRESFVCPQWLPGGKSFWYRKQNDWHSYEFVLVDIVTKSVYPAFDHAKLAEELGRVSDEREAISIAPYKLPFTWIEVEGDTIRFRFNQQIWQYETGKGLSRWDGQFSQANPALAYRPRLPRHVPNGRNVSVTFVNQTRKDISISSFKNETGEAQFYMGLARDCSVALRTNAGQLWRFVDQDSGVLRGHYCVPDKTHDILALGDVDFKEYWGPEEVSLWAPAAEDDDLPDGWVQQDYGGRTWYYDVIAEASSWSRPRADFVREYQPRAPKDEPRIIIRDNVFLLDEEGAKFQLTTDASDDIIYDNSQVYLCPNKQLAIIWQYSGRKNSKAAYTLDYSPPDQIHAKLIKDEYALPGSDIRVHSPLLFNLSTKSKVETCGTLLSDPYEMEHLGWSIDGSEYRFIFKKRGFQCFRVLALTSDGQIRLLLEENSNTFLDHMKFYYRTLRNDSQMIWASERDGYNHLYLIDLEQGRVIRQITKGCWNVKSVEEIDEEEERLLMSAYGFWENEDPYHLHLVGINLDGTDCRALTKGDGTHKWSWPPRINERDYFVDTWSRVDLPPQTVIRSMATGEVQLTIDGTSAENLMCQGWEPHERFAAPGRDGKTLIYGIIARPPNFDQNIQYPVLEIIYSGPQLFFTPKTFGGVGSWAVGGHVVVQMDGMGTNWRSKSFHDVCYKNLKDAGLPDRILWIKEAAKTRPWMDLTRVGIIGASAGGDNALSAILHHGDFYKVAVSDSGSHDHRLGNLEWSEQWMGYPVDESYTDNSNLTHVAKLRDDAKLMLVAGGLDNTVNPVSTMKVVTSLNKHKKDFEFLFMPEGGHNWGIGGPGYLRVRRFLKQNLGSGGDPKIDKTKSQTIDECSTR